MGVLGFLAAVAFVIISCRRKKFSVDDAVYIFVFGMIGAMAGAKILYLITAMPDIVRQRAYFREHPVRFAQAYLYGGMVFYGGLIGGLLAAHRCAGKFGVPIERHYDLFVPAIPLFAGFGRLGCLMEGCCYGRRTRSVFHITFEHSAFAPNHVPLVPTQLYEALFDFLLFLVLVLAGRSDAWVQRLLDLYLVSYAAFRFVLEFFRGDMVRGIFLLSTSQWISMAIITAAIAHLVFRKKRTGKQDL